MIRASLSDSVRIDASRSSTFGILRCERPMFYVRYESGKKQVYLRVTSDNLIVLKLGQAIYSKCC